jgi:Ca2+-transporting ATPase
LFINLVSDSLPAIALGMEEADKDIMDKPPRKKNDNIIGGQHLVDIVFTGVCMTVLVVMTFVLSKMWFGNAIAATMGFYVLDMLQLFHMYNMHTNNSLFKSNPFKNKVMILAFLFGIVLMLIISFVPVLREMFELELLNLPQWLMCIGMAVLIIPIYEVRKLIDNMKEKSKK